MSYVKGSTNTSTQATDVYNELATLLTNHAAWSFVETVTIDTYDYHVWQNLGSANAWGSDFFVIFRLPSSGTGSIVVRTAEEYDGTAKTIRRACWGTQSGRYVWLPKDGGNFELVYDPSDTPASPASFTLDDTSAQVSQLSIPCDDDSLTEYFLFVRTSSLVLATKRHLADTTTATYHGLFQPLATDVEVFPLVQFSMFSPGSHRGWSRWPLHPDFLPHVRTDGLIGAYYGNMYGAARPKRWTVIEEANGTQVMAADNERWDPLFGGVTACRVLLDTSGGIVQGDSSDSYHSRAGHGVSRGLAYDVLDCPTNVNTVEIGDEVDIEGVKHIYLGAYSSSVYWWVSSQDTA